MNECVLKVARVAMRRARRDARGFAALREGGVGRRRADRTGSTKSLESNTDLRRLVTRLLPGLQGDAVWLIDIMGLGPRAASIALGVATGSEGDARVSRAAHRGRKTLARWQTSRALAASVLDGGQQ